MSRRNRLRPPRILLVEDDPGDARIALEVLREANGPSEVDVVRDGEEALAFLRRQGAYAGSRRPDVIVLDLGLPRKDGREVLAEVKGDRGLRRIPVVVLSASRAESEAADCYDLHANSYIRKPESREEFRDAVRSFEDFWFGSATLPDR